MMTLGVIDSDWMVMVGNSSGSLVTIFVGARVIATDWSIIIEIHRDTFQDWLSRI